MSAEQRSLARRLFEPASIDSQSPVARVVTYALLFLWTLVVLVPLYWVLITSFKGPGRGRQRTVLPPFRRLHALARRLGTSCCCRTTRCAPTMNSVVVAVASTLLAVMIGSLAAYALVRIRFQVKLAAVALFLILLVAVIVAVATFGVKWELAVSGGAALFVIALFTLGGAHQGWRSATTTSSSGSSRTASCRRSSRCCRSM